MCSLTSSTDGRHGEPHNGQDEGDLDDLDHGRENAGPVLIHAGRVGRPHGLDGSFHVTGARPRLLSPGVSVLAGERSYEIVGCGGTERDPLLRLAGVDGRDGALALRGEEIRVAADQAPALEDGEWWAHELVGCAVHDGEIEVGEVVGLLELPSCEALEVERAREHGDPLLVPMVKDAIRVVDMHARRIDIDLSFLGPNA